jgi:Tfp pilus assembly protein PilO
MTKPIKRAATTPSRLVTAAKLVAETKKESDAWSNYFRMTTIGLLGILVSIVGYMGSGSLKNEAEMLKVQGEMAGKLSLINQRGSQNRENIAEVRADLKETKNKVDIIREALDRIEARMP